MKNAYQKYSASGNTFLIMNNIDGKIKNYTGVVKNLINLKENKTFDGVIFLEESLTSDFKMNYFNKDGTGNSLCGNGLRATVKYLRDNDFFKDNLLKLESVNKIFDCKINNDKSISVNFPPPDKIKMKFKLKVHFNNMWQLITVSYINLGSPHIVVFTDDIEKPRVKSVEDINITEWGREIRMHRDLLPEGANVNFVEVISSRQGILKIRSYERGVEGETLSCGTGAISAGVVAHAVRGIRKPLTLKTRSGEDLIVNFDIDDFKVKNLSLTGLATKI